MKDIRVVVFDDNLQLRESMFDLLEASKGFICAGVFAHCERVLENIRETRPDVVVMDIEMPGIDGIQAVRIIKEHYPLVKVLMETIFEDDDKIFQSVCNGADGYIVKNNPPESILEAIRDVNAGGAPMTPVIATKVLRMFKSNLSGTSDVSAQLSTREREILKYLVEGMSYKMIADRCFISVETVNGHIKNIYKKLEVHSKSEAVVKAIRKKLI